WSSAEEVALRCRHILSSVFSFPYRSQYQRTILLSALVSLHAFQSVSDSGVGIRLPSHSRTPVDIDVRLKFLCGRRAP
ncbi:hypothetical protein HHX47_DHR2000177, partial [Lentinula edodes]